ncbi:hypothetical protein HHI36_014883 [Cryptolaemus montrouzieri]|uniref:Uncharacterized protein n=1 Tax=Cryptolaemus montrouzieri TaxID=559131 RepID=A0ABD2N558_9CUCU
MFSQITLIFIDFVHQNSEYSSIFLVEYFVAGAHNTSYRAIGLGQRPFLDTPFTTHLRDLGTYKKRGVPSSQSSDDSNSYKQEPQGVGKPKLNTQKDPVPNWRIRLKNASSIKQWRLEQVKDFVEFDSCFVI